MLVPLAAQTVCNVVNILVHHVDLCLHVQGLVTIHSHLVSVRHDLFRVVFEVILGLGDSLRELEHFETDGFNCDDLVGVDVDLLLVAILLSEWLLHIESVDGVIVVSLDNRSVVCALLSSFSFSLGQSISFSFSLGLSISASLGLGLSLSLGLGISLGLSVSLGFGLGLGVSLGFSISGRFSLSAGIGISAGFGISFGLRSNLSCDFGGSLSGGFNLSCHISFGISFDLNGLCGGNKGGKSKNKFHDFLFYINLISDVPCLDFITFSIII